MLDSGKNEAGLAQQFLHTAAYSALESPARGLAQIADHIAGTNFDAGVKSGFKSLGLEAPEAKAYGTSAWYVQQLGGAAGMMLPFLALRSGINNLSNRAFSNALTVKANDGLFRIAGKEALLSGASGLVYGSLLTPSAESLVGKSGFAGDRLKNGIVDGASFAALGLSTTFLGAGLESAAKTIQFSARSGSRLAANSAAILRDPVSAGLISGLPAGAINAEANALRDGRLLPTKDELKESVVGMSFIGGFMGRASKLAEWQGQQHKEQAALYPEIIDRAYKHGQSQSQSQFAAAAAEKAGAVKPARESVGAVAKLEAAAGETVTKQSAPLKGTAFEKLAELKVQEMASLKEVQIAADTAAKLLTDAVKAGEKGGALDIVLGASGVQAPAHAGFLRALEERNVPIGKITGVSGGSLVAALYANKYSPAEIQRILLSDEFRHPRPATLAKCFHVTDPWNLLPYSIDFKPWIQELVETYKLKPQDNLKIVAAERKTHAPVVFEGTNYNIVDALTASTAVTPGIMNMKPVKLGGQELIDGFYYHPIPADLAKAPAVVSKIGFVDTLPTQVLSPWDYFLHLREMGYYEKFNKKYPDPQGHIIAKTGLSDVASTTFGVSYETLLKMVENGHKVTTERLGQPDAQKAIKEARNKEVST